MKKTTRWFCNKPLSPLFDKELQETDLSLSRNPNIDGQAIPNSEIDFINTKDSEAKLSYMEDQASEIQSKTVSSSDGSINVTLVCKN